ncbi:MAG: 2-amino-4-hydroxy-6-hydroxymethyldihydropteridine diphosphokinase [Bacteroidetes bacterium]|nr:MAG: 2-amino-4-hydroxy-6-hydroxymethyldihydropteridine diphosphokinase [Bacteroidota bacterium]
MKLPASSKVITGMGSNLGDRFSALERAMEFIREEAGEITAVSSVWETEPWGFDADEQFLNMVIVLQTTLEPKRFIQLFRSIEGRMGRKKSGGGKYESRVIDLDILFWDDRVISMPGLEVPHPKLHSRRFVLEPLLEVAPEVIHPVTGLTVAEMLQFCDDNSDVRLAARQL